MAKRVHITLYTPKELWKMFWLKFFWPRRKECAEWIEFFEGNLEYRLVNDILINKFCNNGRISDEVAEELELDIKKAIAECSQKTQSLIVTPIYDIEVHE